MLIFTYCDSFLSKSFAYSTLRYQDQFQTSSINPSRRFQEKTTIAQSDGLETVLRIGDGIEGVREDMLSSTS